MMRFSLGVIILCAACARAPDAELDLAAARVESARSADGAIFAAEPLARAETALATAYALTEERSYLAAVHAAGDAVAEADMAFETATVEKKMAEHHVDHCLGELEGLMAIARSRGAPEDELAAYDARYQAIKAIADDGDLLTALDQGLQLKPELLAFETRFRN